MDFPTKFAELEQRAANGLATVKTAAAESRTQLEQRIDQAQVDLDLAQKDVKQKADEAGGRAQSKWVQLRADASAKMESVKAKIDKRNEQIDAEMAAADADIAEGEAADAIGAEDGDTRAGSSGPADSIGRLFTRVRTRPAGGAAALFRRCPPVIAGGWVPAPT